MTARNSILAPAIPGARVAEFRKTPTKEFEATAGSVEFEYVNRGESEHTLVIEGVDGFKLETDPSNDTATGSVELDADEYAIFCDVPGHREAGMEGTLTVQ